MRKKIIIIISSIIIFLILVTSAAFINKVSEGADINIAPKDAKIILDDTKTINSGEIKLLPGIHSLKISRSGFADLEKKFTIKKKTVLKLWLYLDPSSEIGTTYLKNHKSEFQNIYDKEGEQIIKNTSALTVNYPIIKELPISMPPMFSINYDTSKKYPNDSEKIALYIQADTATGKNHALSYIYELGYDPADFEIIFGITPSDEAIGQI